MSVSNVAFPHHYGFRVEVRNCEDFTSKYGYAISDMDACTIIAPDKVIMKEWVQSCLCIYPFESNQGPEDGWSPFRSGVIRHSRYDMSDFEVCYYRLGGDSEQWDFNIKSTNDLTTDVSVDTWLRSIQLFAKLSVGLYLTHVRTHHPPRQVVNELMMTEWRNVHAEFSKLLNQHKFDPSSMALMTNDHWEMLVKLPYSKVFDYWYDDVVQLKIINMAQRFAF